MSHFALLVITEQKPSHDDLTVLLQKWHEFECTGIDDQYVVDVDVTDEVAERFNKDQVVVVTTVPTEDAIEGAIAASRNGSGTVVAQPPAIVRSRWDDVFYTGAPMGIQREFVLPPNSAEKTMPADEARTHGIGPKTMRDAAVDYFGEGVIERSGRFYRRTNPNKKWDGWTVGGRWTGVLVPGYDPSVDPANQETCAICGGSGKRSDDLGRRARANDPTYTCNGCNGTGVKCKWPTRWRKLAGDQMMVRDLPLEELRTKAEMKAAAQWDAAQPVIAGREIPNWDTIREAHSGDIDKARDAYARNPVKLALEAAKLLDAFDDISWFAKTREQVLADARAGAFCFFAVLKDGQWYERGDMGWWGMVHDAKADWPIEFAKLVDGLPATTWLTVIDCHI